MAFAPHSSSPPYATSGTGSNATTAQFSPPAGSLLVACVGADGTGMATGAVTDSVGTLTWTKVSEYTLSTRAAAIFFAPCPSAQTNMTVTVTGAGGHGLGVIVLTDAVTTVGATQNTLSANTLSVTTQGPSSLIVAAAANFTNTNLPSGFGSGQSNVINGNTFSRTDTSHGGNGAMWAWITTAVQGPAGSVVAMSFTGTNSCIAVAEIKNALILVPAPPSIVSAEAFGIPSVSGIDNPRSTPDPTKLGILQSRRTMFTHLNPTSALTGRTIEVGTGTTPRPTTGQLWPRGKK